MIVSPSLKFIFVHIPKNGGTTIETLLMDHIDPATDLHISEAAEIDDNRKVVGTRERATMIKHITAPRLRNALPHGLYDQLFSFAYSRNPYSRCFSAYGFIAARAEIDARKLAKDPTTAPSRDRSKFGTLSFDQVCTNLGAIAATHRLFRPQTFWLPDVDSVDYVGRLENLSEDLRFIYNHLGMPTEKLDAVPVANMKSAKGAWRGMAPESAAAIRKFYAADFERFGYSLDFDADDQAPARKPIVRDEVRVGATKRTRWNASAEPARPPRTARAAKPPKPGDADGIVRQRPAARPSKPLRTKAERGLE